MTVYIGNAVGNENGTASGGEPGNQNGKELRVQAWYKNKKGWRVFRPKSSEVAQKLVYDMRAACENKNIGYSQPKRNTLYTAAKPYGFDCAKVDTPCECDCSSLVRICVLYSGIKVNDFNTASEPTRLLATGEFKEMIGTEYTDTYKKLKAGDILCTAVKGHTAIVLNDGPDVDPPAPTEGHVLVIGGSVNVRTSDSTKGRILTTVHKGDKLPYLGTAPTGWYNVRTKKGDGYISNKKNLTRLEN